MKHWLETREVLDRLAELTQEGKRAALATVVRVRGSAYRHEGAKLLVAEDGSTRGNVSGGCLEADVKEVALRVLASGKVERRAYCGGADEIAAWDLGVGCEGEVELIVELATDPRGNERALLEGTKPFAVCALTDDPSRRLVLTADRQGGTLGDARLDAGAVDIARALLASGESSIHDLAGRDLFVDVLRPPPHLVIVSGGDDARPLATFGAAIGFRVVVVDRRPALVAAKRFPRAAARVVVLPSEIAKHVPLDHDAFVVVMTHNYVDDREYLRALLATDVPYIGVLGPRQRTERILAELGGGEPIDDERVYGPIGLDIGTDGAEQVALSALSEILSVRSGRRPTSLRERVHPIHVDARS